MSILSLPSSDVDSIVILSPVYLPWEWLFPYEPLEPPRAATISPERPYGWGAQNTSTSPALLEGQNSSHCWLNADCVLAQSCMWSHRNPVRFIRWSLFYTRGHWGSQKLGKFPKLVYSLRANQAPLSMGILQARTLEWVAIPYSRGSSQPRDQTEVSHTSGRLFSFRDNKEGVVSRLYISPFLFSFICIVHHAECWTGWNTGWNQDCREKY